MADRPHRCAMCGRSGEAIGDHPLPLLQEAHCIAKRFTRGRNPFTDAEWKVIIESFGPSFGIDENTDPQRTRRLIRDRTVPMCGECHEEVLSEPMYLPKTLDKLAFTSEAIIESKR